MPLKIGTLYLVESSRMCNSTKEQHAIPIACGLDDEFFADWVINQWEKSKQDPQTVVQMGFHFTLGARVMGFD